MVRMAQLRFVAGPAPGYRSDGGCVNVISGQRTGDDGIQAGNVCQQYLIQMLGSAPTDMLLAVLAMRCWRTDTDVARRGDLLFVTAQDAACGYHVSVLTLRQTKNNNALFWRD